GNVSPLPGHSVPMNELFIQGGLMSLRGYRMFSIGPNRTLSSDPAQLSQKALNAGLLGGNFVVGGHSELLYQAELEFPLLKEARIRGVIFFDAGNAFDGSLFDQHPMLRADVGWGFRWFTPIGPLRFEFGYPIFQGGDPQFWFNIGPPF
ncbi:BamA/TamA family outer membrane protein, partial [bacterium]|nr:BamA/TamA family outer membrane protein [bacterium]